MAPKKVVANPPADLKPREGDVALPIDRLLRLSFFARLKDKPSVEKFPGTLAVRRCRAGETIVRQGEAGWTAFCALTGDDIRLILDHRLETTTDEGKRRAVQKEIAELPKLLEQKPNVATVYVAMARRLGLGDGLLARMSQFFRRRTEEAAHLPVNAPPGAVFDVRTDVIHEGDLFGEMSSLYRARWLPARDARQHCRASEERQKLP
jgi:hypothetical protein